MERNFKGIWIPKEIWLDEELSVQEKILLVEIDSLDNELTGCYASNSYFANFFHMSSARITQLINSLVSKGFINTTYERNGKEIVKRVIKINRPPYPKVVNKLTTYLENLTEGSKYSKEGYLENYKENNTYKNNTNINNIKHYDDEELNNIFHEYLKLRKKIKAVNSERAINLLINKLEPYPDDIKKQMIEESIVNSWKSIYPLKDKPKGESPSWLHKEIKNEEEEFYINDEDRKRFGIEKAN